MGSSKKYEVPAEQVSWRCNMADFSFNCTDELAPLQGFIGQDRALAAIQFGLEMDKPGYSLFVTGLTGTGKTSAIKSYVQAIMDERKLKGMNFPIHDWCYVHNFADPDRPQALQLPAGEGKRLQQVLEDLLGTLRDELPKLLASEEYASQRNQMEQESRTSSERTLQELEKVMAIESFGFQFSPTGINLFPLTGEGKAMPTEEFRELGAEERNAIEEKRNRLLERAQDTMKRLRDIERDAQDKLKAHDRSVGDLRLSELFHPPMEHYRDRNEVTTYLGSLKEYALNNLNLFARHEELPLTLATQGKPPFPGTAPGNPCLPFEVNVLVDNSCTQAAPVIIERNPTWINLFGGIERRAVMGAYFSDHTMLKPGSIHQANGGYLVLNARDLLMNPGVWEGLKRAIRDKEVHLEDPSVPPGIMAPQGLRPQPIPWNAKVIVTGEESLYRLLSTADREDFWEMFKVKAEFDSEIDLTSQGVSDYCSFVCRTCETEGLLHADSSGVARIIEYGARLVDDQTKLSSRFGQIKDLLIEADYWARKATSPVITGAHVEKALDEKIHRLNLVEEKIRRLISEGAILVDTKGEVVGQVNGLVVYDLGDFSFGRPSRITAKTFAGRRGVINIERESQLSGRIHDKGVLILSGYLGWKFAQNKPLSLTASLSFEQSYEGIDGDSASSAELYSIMSSLAELPIKQGIAVTGSVNQNGEIQPIGGVNQKVEGFFDVCLVKGLTGQQGVMVPHQNIKNLMLRGEVVEAVKQGRFHIYGVKTIDEGIEVLTGTSAGEHRQDGSYPEGTVNYLVDRRLEELVGSVRGFYAEMLGEAA